MIQSILVAALFATIATAAPLTQGDRDRALSDYHATRKLFLDSIEGLSEAQWTFKPSAGGWSIAEVAEHIALSESTIMSMVRDRILKSPADPAVAARTKGNDAALMANIRDRSTKAQAPEMLKPANKWATREALTAAFKDARDKNIAWVRETQDDLRLHAAPHPAFKELDGYQWVLLLSGHTERHTMQILEVKADPAYPKK